MATEWVLEALTMADTLGGRMHVRWDEGAAATPLGQLVFFAELKNQWGLLGFTPQDINRCQTTARACAVV
jgi:hypothetical protein